MTAGAQVREGDELGENNVVCVWIMEAGARTRGRSRYLLTIQLLVSEMTKQNFDGDAVQHRSNTASGSRIALHGVVQQKQ